MIMNIILPVAVLLIVLMILNVPVYISLLVCGIYMQFFINDMPLQNIFTGMFESLTKNSMLAVPFFVVSGNLLSTSSLGGRLINLCHAFLKRFKSGLALSCVVANAIFGAICGSAPAATATFGKILWEPLRKEYTEEQAAGLITTSGSLSLIIPPSMTMIFFGIVTETSVGKLFMAGFIPGILCVLVLSLYLVFALRKKERARHIPGERLKALKEGIPTLLLPVIILGGIYGGIVSVTEAGAIATLYATIVALFVTKDINIKKLLNVFLTSARTVATVWILVACSNVFSQALTITQVPLYLAEVASDMGKIQFLLMLNIILLIMGCFFDAGSCVLILAPLFFPCAIALGIDPIHLGIIFAINISIGMFTPPFGMSLFISQSVLDRPMGIIARGCVPFLFCYIFVLFVVTYIPSISLFLPSILS